MVEVDSNLFQNILIKKATRGDTFVALNLTIEKTIHNIFL